MKRYLILGALLVASAIGCSQQNPDSGGKAAPAPDASDAAKLEVAMTAAKPANAISVREALTRKDGDKVTVTGRVPGGNLKPFNTALAAVVLMAPEDLDREEIKSEFECEDAATCPSCKRVVDANGVQVEVVDQSGSPIPVSLEGFRGMKKGSDLTIEGTVKKYGKDNKLVRIVATKFYPG